MDRKHVFVALEIRNWREVSRSASVTARFRVPRIGSTRMSGDFHPQQYVYKNGNSLCVSCECDSLNESMGGRRRRRS
jgi:hypothetical protein